MTAWGAWGKCNTATGSCSANSGWRSRSRKVTMKQSCGGSCFPLEEAKKCTPSPSDCVIKYKFVGCFTSRGRLPPSLKELLFTERDRTSSVWNKKIVDWKNWDAYMPALIKRCAEKAFAKGSKLFGLKYYAECWGEKKVTDAEKSFAGMKKTPSNCIKEGYRACQNNDLRCIGKDNGLAVYQVLSQ